MTDQPRLYSLQRLQEIDTSEAFIRQIVGVFLKNVPSDSLVLVKAGIEKDWVTAGLTAHKMKANIDLLCIECLHDEIRTVEQMAKGKIEMADIEGKIHFVNDVIQRAANEMRQDLNL